MAYKVTLGLLLLLVLSLLAWANNSDVELTYYIGEKKTVKLWVALFGSLGIGFLLGGAGWLFTFLRLSASNKGLAWKVEKLEQEIAELRQKPLPDELPVYPAPTLNKAEPAAALPSPGQRGLEEASGGDERRLGSGDLP